MKTISRRAALFLLALIPITAASAEDERPLDALRARLRSIKKPAVLFIGNSYSFDAPSAFRTYASNRGREVRVGQVTNGGWTLARHAGNEKTLRAIREGRWDVVVFQEQSRIPSLPQARRGELMDPPLQTLVAEARRQGAVPVLYQTWGYREGDKTRSGDDFHAMTRRLRTGYQAAAGKAGNLVVIPVGDEWERVFSSGDSARLFRPDGSHPTKFGNQVTARVFYDSLFPRKP